MDNYIKTSRIPALALLLMLSACAPKGEALLARAEGSMAKGDVRSAVIDLKNLVQDEPKNGKARALLGTALIATGDMSAGEIELQKARDLGAPREMLAAPTCRVMLAKGEPEKVLAECKPDLAPASSKVEIQVLAGNALMTLNRAPEARELFEAALAADPDNVEALLGDAGAAFAVDGTPAAKVVLNKASKKIKESTRYWLTVAGMNMEAKDFTGAAKAYQTAIDKSARDPQASSKLMALGGLAEAQMRQGDIAAADATTVKLTEAAPRNLLVKQLRGQVAAAGGKYDEARGLLEEVVSAQPENYHSRTLLGIVNVQQGNLDQAEAHFAAVVANQPNNARAQRLLAEVRSKQGTPAESMAGIKTALEQTGNDPTMLAMASRVSLASGDREQALSYLAQAAAKPASETTPETQLDIANGFLAAGDLDKAIEILEAMPAGGSTDYQREYLLLLSLLKKGDIESAMSQAKALAARSGDKPAVRNLVASVFAAANKPDLAREQLVAAQKLAPDNVEVLMNLARLDLAQNKPVAAEAGFQKILDKDAKNLPATLGLAAAAGARKNPAESQKWLAKASGDHPESPEAQLALAQFYLATNDLAKARAIMDASVKKYPTNAALANARGLVLLGARDLPGATSSFTESVRLAPQADGFRLNLARAQMLGRDTNGAFDSINEVLKTNPASIPALALGASAALQSGNIEKATGYVARISKAAPNSQLSDQLEGDLAMAQKRFKEAIAFYEKADPAGINRNIVLARYLAAQRGNISYPEQPLEGWVVRHPGDIDAIAMLAEWKRSHGDSTGAVRLYEDGLKASPDNGILMNNLAMLYLEHGDGRAVPVAEKANKILPNNPAIQDTYGWALFKAGKNDLALTVLTSAAKVMPGNAEVQYHLAAALAKAGKKADAIAGVKMALGGSLPPSARVDAQRLLTDLSK